MTNDAMEGIMIIDNAGLDISRYLYQNPVLRRPRKINITPSITISVRIFSVLLSVYFPGITGCL